MRTLVTVRGEHRSATQLDGKHANHDVHREKALPGMQSSLPQVLPQDSQPPSPIPRRMNEAEAEPLPGHVRSLVVHPEEGCSGCGQMAK